MIQSMKTYLIPAFCMIINICAACSPGMDVSSPNKQNSISLKLNDQGELSYQIKSGNEILVSQSSIGLSTKDELHSFNKGLKLITTHSRIINEQYNLPTGKCSSYTNYANEKIFTFCNSFGKELELICRAYDNGIAFRQKVLTDSMIIQNETTNFTLKPGVKTWMMDWIRHYENYYPERLIDTISHPTEFLFPVLVQQSSKWMMITEASVYDIPAIHLTKKPFSNTFQLVFAKEDSLFKVQHEFQSSWKTFIIGNKLKDIVESTLVENLNPSCSFKNTDWITPGVAVFPWWGNHLANSYIDTLKSYIDLAKEMKWEWLEFDVSLINTPLRASKEWEDVDWIPELTQYAKEKGIKVYGWDEIKTLDNAKGRDYVFNRYKKMGIDGIKIDYIDSDSQYAMKFRDTICAEAAKQHLMVSFHGETLPRGHRRKYPNIMTNEAVRGAEYYTFSGYPCANSRHNCTLPFTRNVVGPMDYTPVTFTIRKENPRTTTYCHELALAFVFESGWICMADHPEAYLESPARPILEKIEAAWDESRFIDGYPGEYFCIARRKGNKWFIAAINNEQARKLQIPLSFLPKGEHKITIYSDKKGEEMHSCSILSIQKNYIDSLDLSLNSNGGIVIDID